MQVLARGHAGRAKFLDLARVGRVEGGRARSRKAAAKRKVELHEGQLVVFLQSRYWQNANLNLAVDCRPRVHGDLAVRLQYSLMDWLKTRP